MEGERVGIGELRFRSWIDGRGVWSCARFSGGCGRGKGGIGKRGEDRSLQGECLV